MTLETHTVRQVFVEYESFLGDDKHAYVCVTEWHNGEGVDVHMDESNQGQAFLLTWDQWRALKKAMKRILKGKS